jgi:hypothetical protein
MSDFRLFETWYDENFCSSLLAFAMRQSPDFALRIIDLLWTKSGKSPARQITVRDIEREYPIEVAGSRSPRRADICIEADVDGRSLLSLVEAKIQSGEQQRQLIDDRSWLEDQKADERILATLSKYPVAWSAKPDVELRWADVTPLVAQTRERAKPDSFEERFWCQFREHLEEIMATFEGFTLGFSNVHRLMQEIVLFLQTVLDKAGVTKLYDDWKADRIAYWLPNEQASVGFYWWEKWRDPSHENTLFVIKYKPEKREIPIASLQEIGAQSAAAKQHNWLDEYVSKIAAEIRKALE